MRFVIEGLKSVEADVVKFSKGVDNVIKRIRAFADDGGLQDVTGTLTLELYTTSARSTSVASVAVTATVAAAGTASVTLSAANATFGPGTYKAFFKINNAGAITISTNYVTVVVN